MLWGKIMDEKYRNMIKQIKESDLIGELGNLADVFEGSYSSIRKYIDESREQQNEEVFLSIVVPTYKRPLLLKQTLESIISQKGFSNYEVLIVDNEGISRNGVISETEKVIRDLQNDHIVYYQNEKEYPSVINWNYCLALARGKWICMVHDDDVLLPDHLSTMYQLVCANSEIDFVGCANYSFKSIAELTNITKSSRTNIKKVRFEEFMYGMPVSLLGAFFRRDSAVQIGGFDGKSYIGDYVFVAKFAYSFNVYLYNCPLYGYRIGMFQDSANNEMNYVRRVADYYLWRAIASRRSGIFRELYMKNCQYNLINRITEYNKDDKYGSNHYIDVDSIIKECDINKNKLYRWEYYVCKGIHFLNIVFVGT